MDGWVRVKRLKLTSRKFFNKYFVEFEIETAKENKGTLYIEGPACNEMFNELFHKRLIPGAVGGTSKAIREIKDIREGSIAEALHLAVFTFSLEK